MTMGKKETMEGIELPNQKGIKTLRKKENYNYQEILEVDTIKEERKSEKRISQKKKNKTLQQKFHQRNKHLGSPFCKMLWTILKMYKRET